VEVDMHTICPLCRKENDDNYPVEVNGHIKEGTPKIKWYQFYVVVRGRRW